MRSSTHKQVEDKLEERIMREYEGVIIERNVRYTHPDGKNGEMDFLLYDALGDSLSCEVYEVKLTNGRKQKVKSVSQLERARHYLTRHEGWKKVLCHYCAENPGDGSLYIVKNII